MEAFGVDMKSLHEFSSEKLSAVCRVVKFHPSQNICIGGDSMGFIYPFMKPSLPDYPETKEEKEEFLEEEEVLVNQKEEEDLKMEDEYENGKGDEAKEDDEEGKDFID